MIQNLRKEIQKIATPERAKANAWFFKTGKGEYGEGDEFIGLTVPSSRKIAIQFSDLSLEEVQDLIKSPIHEERLIALLILVHKFEKGLYKERNQIYIFYLKNMQYINNWDLVDTSADKIVGEYLYQNSQDDSLLKVRNHNLKLLEKLAKSENLWERRIAILATFAFIIHGESSQTLQIAEILLHDKHDLIQKAVGWLLREVGKRVSEADEVHFLQKHYKTMPRTMLRYAIERFPKEKRLMYLTGTI